MMKNIILIFLLIFVAGKYNAQSDDQSITGLQINQISESQINVNLKVNSSDFAIYNSYIAEINGNIVTLKVCYIITFGQLETNLENDFVVNIPAAPGNYIFNVEIYRANLGICNFQALYLLDSASLDFTNPFTGTISLSTTDFESKDKNVDLYPNPVKDILHFSEEVSTIKITDLSGKAVKQFTSLGKSVDVSSLVKGNYMITIVTKTGETITKKLIKK